jgi:hypothetical protein
VRARAQFLVRRLDAAQRPPQHADYDDSTLHIPKSDFDQLSDMMKQYWSYKSTHMNELVFLQWGTFCKCDHAITCTLTIGGCCDR